MGYDNWRTTEPDDDRWLRRPRCQKIGCDNAITFPDFETLCNEHLIEAERLQRRLAEEFAQYDV
jgi:hypothetical protein